VSLHIHFESEAIRIRNDCFRILLNVLDPSTGSGSGSTTLVRRARSAPSEEELPVLAVDESEAGIDVGVVFVQHILHLSTGAGSALAVHVHAYPLSQLPHILFPNKNKLTYTALYSYTYRLMKLLFNHEKQDHVL
jgi:hypothetical protein